MALQLIEGAYGSPRWSYEFLDCGMPMTFDTYSNCAFQCQYCFSAFQRGIGRAGEHYRDFTAKSVNVDRVKKLFSDPDSLQDTPMRQFIWYIKGRHTLQWGGLSDGFDWYERKFGKSLELLRFFNEINYPISISTKGVWMLDDARYVEQFTNRPNIQMKISLITLDPHMAARIEKGVASPAQRINALRRFKELGVGVTTLRFRPYILNLSEFTAEQMIQAAADAGCYSVSAEFLCIEGRNAGAGRERVRQLSRVLGYDVQAFYRKHSLGQSGLLRLNYEIKRPHFERLIYWGQKYGVKIAISDAHHKEKGESPACCGLPAEGSILSNVHRGQYTAAIILAHKQGYVRWSDIADDAAGLKNIPFESAEGYNQGTTHNRAKYRYLTLFDIMHNIWNNTRSQSSPARYFGGALFPVGTDATGDLVYLYNAPYVECGVKVKNGLELAAMLDLDLAAIGVVNVPDLHPVEG